MRFGICDLLVIFASINFCFSLNKGNDFISTFDPSLRIRTMSPYEPNPLGIDLISSILLNETCVLFLPNHPPSIVILLFVIIYLNHNDLTIAAKVNGKPRIVRPASRFIIRSLLAGPVSYTHLTLPTSDLV